MSKVRTLGQRTQSVSQSSLVEGRYEGACVSDLRRLEREVEAFCLPLGS